MQHSSQLRSEIWFAPQAAASWVARHLLQSGTRQTDLDNSVIQELEVLTRVSWILKNNILMT